MGIISVSKEYLPDDMIQVTLETTEQRSTSFVSSEHLVYAKVEQLKRLYFSQDDTIEFQ